MARYRELRNLRRIRFVTFHPSFSYEEFVEGIRPSTEGGARPVRRAARRLQAGGHVRPRAVRARPRAPRRRSTSRGGSSSRCRSATRRRATKRGSTTTDSRTTTSATASRRRSTSAGATRCRPCGSVQGEPPRRERTPTTAITAVHYIKNELRKGDIVLVSDGNTRFRAIGEVTGPYQYQPREEGYQHRRPVRWLWTSAESLPIDTVFAKRLSQMSIYLMDQGAVKWSALQELLSPKGAGGRPRTASWSSTRSTGRTSRRRSASSSRCSSRASGWGSGTSRRPSCPTAASASASRRTSIVVGTMNTADRSIALMDTALRRRFSFREMVPRPELLSDDLDGINLQALLKAMNTRIEAPVRPGPRPRAHAT